MEQGHGGVEVGLDKCFVQRWVSALASLAWRLPTTPSAASLHLHLLT
jgi:hypothetical protein